MVISSSKIDDSCYDLEQYIYEELLKYDNEKLNYLKEHNLLKPFIMKMILNQRNYYRSVYNLYFRQFNKLNIVDDILNEDDIKVKEEKEEKYDTIDYLFYDKYDLNNYSGYTINDKFNYSSLEIYKHYVKKEHSYTSLSNSLNISRGTVAKLISHAKYLIKKEYERRKK